ncbi:MAG: hypothetical protein ACRDJI_10500 [Actinomycetota bacterium]
MPVARAIAAAAFVAALGFVLAWPVIHADRDDVPRGWTTKEDPRLGLTIQYPMTWEVQRFDNRVGRATHTGLIISNVVHHFRHPELVRGSVTSSWDMRDLPDHAVVVEVSQISRIVELCGETSSFPLALEDAQVVSGVWGSPPRLFLPGCAGGKYRFGLHVWMWPDSSYGDRRIARQIVQSVRPLT